MLMHAYNEKERQTEERGDFHEFHMKSELSQIIIARNSMLNKGSSGKCIKTVLNTNSPSMLQI